MLGRGDGDLKIIRTSVLAAAAFSIAACAPGAAQEAPYAADVSVIWPQPQVTQSLVERPSRILFVGNSYFYYNDSLHNHVQRFAVAAGVLERSELTFKSATIGGAALRDHAIDHLLLPDNLRVDEPFELVIMQGISSAALSEGNRARFRSAAADHAEKIRRAGGQPVLYMTPAYATQHSRYRPDMIDDVAALYVETGNELDAMVIPVGLAFAEATRRRPDSVLHKQFDGSHPSLLGTYLAAATVFASLYDVSPVGVDYDYFGAVSEQDARFLQTVAQDTVARFYGRVQ